MTEGEYVYRSGADWPEYHDDNATLTDEVSAEFEDILLDMEESSSISREDVYKKYNNSDETLIVIGDSWTWGDSLGDHRVDEIYGSLLADRLGMNLINHATCGCSNFNILEYLKKQASSKHDLYVVTLTETGRGINKDNHLSNPHDTLVFHEKKVYDDIEKIAEDFGINVLVFRNFTKDFPEVNRNKHKTWLQVIHENAGIDYDLDDILMTGSVSGIGLENFFMYKQWMVDQLTRAEPLWDFLDASPLNHKKATRHPTKEAHQLWADYIYEVITNEKETTA